MSDRISYPHLMHMTSNQLHNYLEGKKNYNAELKAHIKEVVKRQQDARANRGRSKFQVRKHWEPLIDTLQKEVKKVRACMSYTGRTSQEHEAKRQHALTTYHATLKPLLKRFRTAKAQGLTPLKLMEALKEQGRTIPNGGVHWPDWVSDKKRLEVEVAFDAVPQAYRARRITPFALPPDTASPTPASLGRPKQPGQNSVQPIPQPAQPTQPKE